MPESDRIASAKEILAFWFEELSEKDWFKPTPMLDAQIFRRFRATHLALSRSVDAQWHATPQARLAAIIVLDQLPRNMYRNSPLAFACDGIARREARLALEEGADKALHARERAFVYLPFEHSEAIEDQELSVSLFSALDNPETLDYAQRHREIIRRFNRFPHRNDILARSSTAEEIEFLKQPGSSF
jgi:uncharacterized protein (DUF924 family)